MINSWYRWRNSGAENKGLAKVTHVLSRWAGLASQNSGRCGVFGERIKLLGTLGAAQGFRYPDRESRRSQMWEGPDKWVLTLEGLWESNKNYGDLPLMERTSLPFWMVPSWEASPLGNTLWTWANQRRSGPRTYHIGSGFLLEEDHDQLNLGSCCLVAKRPPLLWPHEL